MASHQSAMRQTHETHVHLAGELCPVCDQPIPNEKADEVRTRVKAREAALLETANARAAKQLALEKQRIEANASAAVEEVKKESAEALTKATSAFAGKEAAAREAGKNDADSALQAKLSAAEAAKVAAEAAKTQSETTAQNRFAALEQKNKTAAAKLEALKAEQEKTVAERVNEARDALERDNENKLSAQIAEHAKEMLRVTGHVDDLKRQLEKKNNEQLGEGAEIDLFEALKSAFSSDRFDRVAKGAAGADIIQTVVHNDREYGKIIYDSKNRTAWRNDYVSKLVADQTAARADYAILSTRKFPADERELTVCDNVIVVSPARAVVLAHIVRKHIIQVHMLRLSKSERAEKMAALYDFITSERCGHLLLRIESHTDDLLELQVKEKKAHDTLWNKQGHHLRSILKVKSDLDNEIDQIISADDGLEIVS